MFSTTTQTVFMLLLLLCGGKAFSQNPNCPKELFFKTLGAETQSEFGTALVHSTDGSIYLSGRSGPQTFIRKMNTAGEEIWTRSFQISPFEPITPIHLIEDSEGLLVGCGTQQQFAGATRGFVFRYSPADNQILWAHPVIGNNPAAAGIIEKPGGGSFVYYQNPRLSSGETDIEILDLERATGNIIPAFATRYEHISYDLMAKMVFSADGSLYGLGSAAGRHGTTEDARRLLLTRLNPTNGMPIWAQLSHVDTMDNADFIGRDLLVDGSSLVAAYVGDEDTTDSLVYEAYLQKTDLDGTVLWIKKYDLPTQILRVISLSDGYLLSGQQGNGAQYFVLKVDKEGEVLWGKSLNYGPTGSGDLSSLGTGQSIAIADSLYFTGFSPAGVGDVFLWKMLQNGTTNDSCGFISDLSVVASDVSNPVITDISLQMLLSSTTITNVTPSLNAATLTENQICPDCTIPNPCPEDNDFDIQLSGFSCSNNQVKMTMTFCDLNGGAVPDGISISLYNGNPFEVAADRLTTIQYDITSDPSLDSCASITLQNLVNLLGLQNLQNGAYIYAVINDTGDANTPFSVSDFPISDVLECNYGNNLDSIEVLIPYGAPLSLGADVSICANQNTVLDGGPGYSRYQWSNGITTQTNTISFGGQYRLTVTDFCGFQQTDTIQVTVEPLAFLQENGEFCPGKSVTIRGFTFNQAGTFQRTIPGLSGQCDTNATFSITQLPYEERIENISFCPFTTVTINGVTYEDSGLARDTVTSVTACDTIVFYFLNQLPLPFRNLQFDICPGDSVVYNGIAYIQSISFTDTLFSSGVGCDTLVYFSVDLLPQPALQDTLQFCPGTTVIIGGQPYTQPGEVVTTLPGSNGDCDTLATYTLVWLAAPMLDQTIQFCQGASVEIDGQTYTQPGTVLGTIPGNGIDCDTLITYTLEWLPTPIRAEDISFCPGTSVAIDGQTYDQPGTVLQTIAGTAGGCDTLVTYTLSFSPLPTRAETIEFCAGDQVILGGQTYTQPSTVTLTLPSNGNVCDTVVTYTLQYIVTQGSDLTLACPPNVLVTTTPGSGPALATYNDPIATSDCICPGIAFTLTSGPASGDLFPVGNTQVCYEAQDSCGTIENCCFNVSVSEEDPCDTKTVGCVRYDLLRITANAKKELTYQIRVTNNCSGKLLYTAIQLPNGVTAVSPANLSTYTSPGGRNYAVRNPNFSPFYSIRFKSTTDSISNGASDVFEYTLPAQAQVSFIHITSRVATQNFYAAHLNAFNCPIGISLSEERGEATTGPTGSTGNLLVFPNPSNGDLYADLTRWQGMDVQIQVLDSRGARVEAMTVAAGSDVQRISWSGQLASGLYFLEFRAQDGTREVVRVVLER